MYMYMLGGISMLALDRNVNEFIFHILRILLYDWSKVNHVMKDSSPSIGGRSKKFVTLCR